MMTPFFRRFVDSLDGLDWRHLGKAHQQLEVLLSLVYANRELLRQEFESYTPEERMTLAADSHELSTHFKWSVYRSAEFGYEIWGHEYKPADSIKPGYAVVPHNHRYWFSSLILEGGFEHNVYGVKGVVPGESSFRELHLANKSSYAKSNVYTVSPKVIHSLSEIQQPTTTLVVGSRAVRPFSEEFDIRTLQILRHEPLLTRVKNSHPLSRKF